MEWLAWVVVGAIAGWLAGLLVKGDEGLGVIGHVVLGLVGALLGGWVVSQVTGNDPMDGVFDISTILTAVIGAVVLVLVVSMLMGRRRTGSGPV
ncbi:MAG TPA: GlsB/YeaQ/YmgE family stress response membrane protein [Candidatus Dormibacteraeota bacterium]|nr:GlsB/YeaQ/YmgE family stress response membrane protein [Candidatus Dormibacteraeota bacterium]